MFKRLIKNKKAQQTAEYAILIALVVGAVIAMQTYAQRTIQARIRGASKYMATGLADASGQTSNILGTELQYEPYYLDQQYDVTRADTTDQTITPSLNISRSDSTSTRTRGSGGYQQTTYSANDNTTW
jgi:Flp pilus assembly pilin Flp